MSPTRWLVPKLLDQYRLLSKEPGTREPDDAWFEEMSRLIYARGPETAMDAVAAALAEGISYEAVGQSISLACNAFVLRLDDGRRCHGDSFGVHTSDATNAWRNMVRLSNRRNAVVGLLVCAYYAADKRNFPEGELYPHDAHREAIKTTGANLLLREADAAIRDNDQGRVAAAIQIYGEQGYAPRPVFDLMLRYAVSEGGRLHGEKYYCTVTEEFATTRPAFRWRQMVALARVTMSCYGYNREDEAGYRAPGYEEACRLLQVDV